MTADTAAVLAVLRRLDTHYAARVPLDRPYWVAYPHYGVWRVSPSDWDGRAPEDLCGPGDAGEERALRVAIKRNRSLCPAEPVAVEVDVCN